MRTFLTKINNSNRSKFNPHHQQVQQWKKIQLSTGKRTPTPKKRFTFKYPANWTQKANLLISQPTCEQKITDCFQHVPPYENVSDAQCRLGECDDLSLTITEHRSIESATSTLEHDKDITSSLPESLIRIGSKAYVTYGRSEYHTIIIPLTDNVVELYLTDTGQVDNIDQQILATFKFTDIDVK